MSTRKNYAFLPAFLSLITKHNGWPPHSLQPTLLRTWRKTGIKTPTYTSIRGGGCASKKDLYDLLRLHTENAYPNFSKAVSEFLATANIGRELTLTELFDATTTPVESLDHLTLGGTALIDWAARRWMRPCRFVSSCSTDSEIGTLSRWIALVAASQVPETKMLHGSVACDALFQLWGINERSWPSQMKRWSHAVPWAIIFSGDSSSRDSDSFCATGGNIALPLSREAHDQVLSCKIALDDIADEHLTVPAYSVFLHSTCESPEIRHENPTANSLISLMWQIAALSGDMETRVLAPASIPLSEKRIRESGFSQIGQCRMENRVLSLWDRRPNTFEAFVLDAMRCALRREGFVSRPPCQVLSESI